MNLLIDIGNSRIKWALAQGETLTGDVAHYQTSATPQQLAPEELIEKLVEDIDARILSDNLSLKAVWIASVGDEAFTGVLAVQARDHWRVPFEAVKASAAAHGVRNSYKEPAQMGVDRWVALIAARNLVPGRAVVVVDAGTAITIDTLDADGNFLGGLIFPGAALARQSLLANTDRIYESDETDASQLSPFGVTTGECVHRGSRFAAVGGVQFALTRVTNALGEMPEVILCGGGADSIGEHLDHEVIHKPWLVLEGLALLANRD